MSVKLNILRKLVRELIKREIEEATMTGNIDGGAGPPKTPLAFKKKKKGQDESGLQDGHVDPTVATDYEKVKESVNEAIKPQGYSQLNTMVKHATIYLRDLSKALRKQDDDAVLREVHFLAAQFTTMEKMMKDKKWNAKYSESVNEGKVLKFTDIKDRSLEKHLKVVTKKVGAELEKISGGFQVSGNVRDLTTVVDYVFDKSIKKGLMKGGGMSKINYVNESDLGLTYKKGKTVKVTHKKSGKELIIIDKPNVKREYEKIGYFAEGTVNELQMAPFSSQEARSHINSDIKDMSKLLGKTSQQVIKIMMNGVRKGKYTAMDISRGIKEGPARRTHYGEMDFIQELWHKVRDGFRRYSKDRKLS